MRIEEVRYSTDAGEATVHNHFHYYGECLKDTNDTEGGGGVRGWLTSLVQDDACGPFEGGRVEVVGDQGGVKVEYEVWGRFVYPFPDRFGGRVHARS